MSTAPPIEPLRQPPRTLCYCVSCGEHTPHELLEGEGIVAKVCVRCAERQLTDMLARD